MVDWLEEAGMVGGPIDEKYSGVEKLNPSSLEGVCRAAEVVSGRHEVGCGRGAWRGFRSAAGFHAAPLLWFEFDTMIGWP